MRDEQMRRIFALKRAAEELANPTSHYGKWAREKLPHTTGLSAEGVDYALQNCLEFDVPRGTLSSLTRTAPAARRAHVLLSSNVFTATFRAILLALCQSDKVTVRPSRREPLMAELLHEASGGAFEIADELKPEPGDHYWAYGSDETLVTLLRKLPSGVEFHGHGFGLGLAIFREGAGVRAADLERAARALSFDVCAFDQRGCLSPRILLIDGSRAFAESVCDALVTELDRRELEIPRGELTSDEQADARWHSDTIRFVGSFAPAGKGLVFLDPETDRMILPPVGRYLSVTVARDVLPLVKRLGDRITTVGLFEGGNLEGILREAIGERRFVDVGEMQKPALDGPVDLRKGWRSVTT